MATERIAINKEYNLLSVFDSDGSKVDELPQTTDSSDLEVLINSVKAATWDFASLSISVAEPRIFIFKDTFPSGNQQFEEIDYTALTAPQQTIVNDFIALF